MELKRTNLNDKITDTINDFNDNWGVIEQEVNKKPDGLLVKNEIVNGDFSDGTTGWNATGGGGSDLIYKNGAGSKVGDGSSQVLTMSTQQTISTPTNDKFYLRSEVMTPSDVPAISLQIRTSSLQTAHTINTPIKNQWYVPSGIVVSAGEFVGAYVRNVITFPDATSAIGKELNCKYIMTINLTQTFGAGNEPTKEEMDALIEITGYIDDEYILSNLELVNWLLSLIRNNTLATTALGGTI